ncbi:hypothetical protein B0H17DRAFT_1139891 [Mycena rosella]|uniref:Uncharacterized protein n=1 Tax=Mycena rosella TaxID=1033263 RepID=A0AAD7D3L4_MYCRO|nr:hypothetical protein B0H17DRAFT_1139891 [Mycena rosella]
MATFILAPSISHDQAIEMLSDMHDNLSQVIKSVQQTAHRTHCSPAFNIGVPLPTQAIYITGYNTADGYMQGQAPIEAPPQPKASGSSAKLVMFLGCCKVWCGKIEWMILGEHPAIPNNSG